MTDWDRIVAAHGDAVWRKACRLLGNQADAADCYQDAFLAALEFSRGQKVRSWPGLLSKLATFKAMDILRQRVRHSRDWNGLADRAATASPDPEPDKRLAGAEIAENLRMALAELPDGQAEVFCLRHLEEMSYRQIAKLLGMTTSAVGVTLHRARARLRELLSPQASQEGVADVEVSR